MQPAYVEAAVACVLYGVWCARMGRWRRYWFAEGGRVALAIVRIAVAIAVMLTLARLRGTWPANAVGAPGPHHVYRPVGIWMTAGHWMPSDGFLDALWIVAWLGAIAMLVGAFTRAAIAIAFVAGVALAAVSYSANATWSHQYNVVWIAMLALQGARAGDALSIDRLARKLRKLPPRDVPCGYQWSLRLVQLAVALMFFSGMFHKIIHGHFTLRWALSDNLRHHLLVRYDLAGLDRPAIVDWLIDDSWRYESAALLNLVTQALPLGAVFLVRRPILRAACGAFFVVETIGLGVVMQLWNLHWLPLAAVFVDWEALIGTIVPLAPPAPAPASWRPPRAAHAFVIAFVVYDAITALAPGLDQKLNTYPFSGFPMFAQVRARAPYGEHLPYSMSGGYVELVGERAIDERAYRDFDYTYRTLADVRDGAELKKRLAETLADAQRRFPDWHLHAIRVHRAIYECPAYPEPARLDRRDIALLGEYRDDGTFRSLLGRVDYDAGTWTAKPSPRGIDDRGARLVYYRDDLPAPIEAAAGARSFAGASDDALHVVEVVDGTPWLVASVRGR